MSRILLHPGSCHTPEDVMAAERLTGLVAVADGERAVLVARERPGAGIDTRAWTAPAAPLFGGGGETA